MPEPGCITSLWWRGEESGSWQDLFLRPFPTDKYMAMVDKAKTMSVNVVLVKTVAGEWWPIITGIMGKSTPIIRPFKWGGRNFPHFSSTRTPGTLPPPSSTIMTGKCSLHQRVKSLLFTGRYIFFYSFSRFLSSSLSSQNRSFIHRTQTSKCSTSSSWWNRPCFSTPNNMDFDSLRMDICSVSIFNEPFDKVS